MLLLITPQTRPYLQKLATLSVAISLTIALAEITRILKRQYQDAYDDAEELRSYIDEGVTLKVMRVVSDVFLWLAQVQTLIRLFPRHREKKIIKWLGLILIVIDTVFWSLKSFLQYKDDDQSFRDAVPALAYLFQIILSVLYAAYVIYYSISKRRFAYHINNLILAILSILAVMTPIIFFLLDISWQYVFGWGDFVRWVGAAAASVVVWEWVERIEYLESKEQETGVLGRQVFEDEMLETGTSRGFRAPTDGQSRRRRRPPPPSGDSSDAQSRAPSNQRLENGDDCDYESRGQTSNGGILSSIIGRISRSSSAAISESNDAVTRLQSNHSSIFPFTQTPAPLPVRQRSPRDLEMGDNDEDEDYSYNDNEDENENEEASVQDQDEVAITEMEAAARKEGGRGLAERLRARAQRRRRTQIQADAYSRSDGYGTRTRGEGGLAASIKDIIESGRAFLFGVRPSSRATTGTSGTSYFVNGGSSINMENSNQSIISSPANGRPGSGMASMVMPSDEPRVRYIHPLKRGQSRSTYSPASSPQSFAQSQVRSGSSNASVANTPPIPSVTFSDSMMRRSPAVAGAGTPLSSVTERRVDYTPEQTHHGLSRDLGGNNSDDDDDDDDLYDDESDGEEAFVVRSTGADSEIAILSNRSLPVHTLAAEQPPAFEPIAGFERGDYWDEKAIPVAASQEHCAIATQEEVVQTTRTRVTLEPTERGVRLAVQRLTGARDWCVSQAESEHAEVDPESRTE